MNLYCSCWTSGTSQIVSVFVPISIMLIINTGIYLLLCKNQCRCCGKVIGTEQFKVMRIILKSQKNLNDMHRKRQIAILSTCFFNMGITWFFSILVMIPSNVYTQTIFAFLFCFFNSLQGFFIFFVYNFLSKSKRENLKQSFKNTLTQIKRQFSSSASTASNYTFSSTIN